MSSHCLLAVLFLVAAVPAQNSMRKIRPRPSATAAKAGTAVQWRTDVAAALAESAKTGRPVFWYVPTVAGSPMDRKPEIDRYMMAGPFSWPRLIALLNESFIPVRAAARGKLAAAHNLRRNEFIEPGYLVLDRDGKELLRKDELTTFHEAWFLAPLAMLVKRELPAKTTDGSDKRSVAEQEFHAGVRLFHSGSSDQAIQLWRKLAEEHPEDPIGWKAAAEAEGHGPFRFGFEVFDPLPAAVMQGESRGSRAPDKVYDEVTLRKNSLDFLCRMQLANGGWEDSRYDFGGTDGLPNVYTACTAIIAEALLEELHAKTVVGDPKRMAKALARAMRYVSDDKNVNFEDRDELIWAHIYRTHVLCRFLELRKDKADEKESAAVREKLRGVVQHMFAMQPGNGLWYHEYANPFVCADVLYALHRARANGIELDDPKVTRGIQALKRCRADTGAFSYGQTRRPGRRVEGAAGRMPLCELALFSFGESTPQDLERAVVTAFTHHDLLESVRKYDDHANREGYGGFFFWFDMLGRTRAMAKVADVQRRQLLEFRQRVFITKKLPEIDGCFVDSHELGRTYGTAMALLCMAELRRLRGE